MLNAVIAIAVVGAITAGVAQQRTQRMRIDEGRRVGDALAVMGAAVQTFVTTYEIQIQKNDPLVLPAAPGQTPRTLARARDFTIDDVLMTLNIRGISSQVPFVGGSYKIELKGGAIDNPRCQELLNGGITDVAEDGRKLGPSALLAEPLCRVTGIAYTERPVLRHGKPDRVFLNAALQAVGVDGGVSGSNGKNDFRFLQNLLVGTGGAPERTLRNPSGQPHVLARFFDSRRTAFKPELPPEPPKPEPDPDLNPKPDPDPTPTPTPDPTPNPTPDPTPDPDPRPTPDPTPKPEPNPGPAPEPVPQPKPEPGKPLTPAGQSCFRSGAQPLTVDGRNTMCGPLEMGEFSLTRMGGDIEVGGHVYANYMRIGMDIAGMQNSNQPRLGESRTPGAGQFSTQGDVVVGDSFFSRALHFGDAKTFDVDLPCGQAHALAGMPFDAQLDGPRDASASVLTCTRTAYRSRTAIAQSPRVQGGVTHWTLGGEQLSATALSSPTQGNFVWRPMTQADRFHQIFEVNQTGRYDLGMWRSCQALPRLRGAALRLVMRGRAPSWGVEVTAGGEPVQIYCEGGLQ